MTNEQLALLLNSYYQRLSAILNQIDEDLGDTAARYNEANYEWIGEGNEPMIAMKSIDKRYKLITTSTGRAIPLDPLSEFLDSLESDIEKLNPP